MPDHTHWHTYGCANAHTRYDSSGREIRPTRQHTTRTRDRYQCPHGDSNLQSQQVSDRSPTSWIARPPGSAQLIFIPRIFHWRNKIYTRGCSQNFKNAPFNKEKITVAISLCACLPGDLVRYLQNWKLRAEYKCSGRYGSWNFGSSPKHLHYTHPPITVFSGAQVQSQVGRFTYIQPPLPANCVYVNTLPSQVIHPVTRIPRQNLRCTLPHVSIYMPCRLPTIKQKLFHDPSQNKMPITTGSDYLTLSTQHHSFALPSCLNSIMWLTASVV